MLNPVYVSDTKQGRRYLFLITFPITPSDLGIFALAGGLILPVAAADREFSFANLPSRKIQYWTFTPSAKIGASVDDGGGAKHVPFVEKGFSVAAVGDFYTFGNWSTPLIMAVDEVYRAAGQLRVIMPPNVLVLGNVLAPAIPLAGPAIGVNSTGVIFFWIEVFY